MSKKAKDFAIATKDIINPSLIPANAPIPIDVSSNSLICV
jgi:hypothetical protein